MLLDPGGSVPLHAHLRQDERVEVLEGCVTVRVGRRERTLAAGESVDVPRRKMHVVRNADVSASRFLLEVRPARRMQTAMRATFVAMRPLQPLARRRRARPPP